MQRIDELLRLQYGAVELGQARAPAAIKSPLKNYFKAISMR